MSELRVVKLTDIKPNPYRDLVGNPLIPQKVAALVQSITNTDFWTNVNARPSKDGTVELAYGHTRIAAAKEAGLKEVELVIQDRTDEEMMLMMHDENSEEYGYNVLSVIEIVRAVVLAYAKGTIKLDPPGKDTPKAHIRYAPSFIPGEPSRIESEGPYTVDSIAAFLKMTRNGKKDERASRSVVAALNALSLMEVTKGAKKPITEQSFAKLNSTQFYETVRELLDGYKRYLKQAENRLRKEEAEAKRLADLREKAEKEKLATEQRVKDAEDAATKARAAQAAAAAQRKLDEAKEQERKQKGQQDRAKAAVSDAANSLAGSAPKAHTPATPAPSKEYKPSTTKSNSESVGRVAKKVTTAINKILGDNDTTTYQLKEVLRSKTNLPDAPKDALVKALTKAAERLTDAATKLKK